MIYLNTNPQLKEILAAQSITNYLPAYTGESAGLDLYTTETITVPGIEVKKEYIYNAFTSGYSVQNLEHNHEITKHERTLIPTGLRVHIPKNYVGLIVERGSVSKTPLKIRAGVIDPGYSGEVFINCVSVRETYTLKKGEKTPFQIIFVPFASTFALVDDDLFAELHANSARRDGAIGSSDSTIPNSPEVTIVH